MKHVLRLFWWNDTIFEDEDDRARATLHHSSGSEVTPAHGVMAIWKTDGGLRIVEAERLDRYTDALLGEVSSESLVTDPSFFPHRIGPSRPTFPRAPSLQLRNPRWPCRSP